MRFDKVKTNGVHYTPPELAEFLADVMVAHMTIGDRAMEVLDPACGDGALLQAFVNAFPPSSQKHLSLVGYETDQVAIDRARSLLERTDVADTLLQYEDFLTLECVASPQRSLFESQQTQRLMFDAVIANPPYVRTQVLGAKKSQALARRFGLSGRVDLYQAFTRAMANVLKPGGVLGLLTSNRFLTIKAGESLRRLLRTEFDVKAVYDLGDTKLFSAAVLPVIVVATKRAGSRNKSRCTFDRVYACPNSGSSATWFSHVLQALLDQNVNGIIETDAGYFRLERGTLSYGQKPNDVWTLSTPEYDEWLNTVRSRQACTIQDVAVVRVGIKTTADDVFVRNDWDSLPASTQPEAELLHPLLTHHEAARWRTSVKPQKKVLYPHIMKEGKRAPVELLEYPRSGIYLKANKERLLRRKYVTNAGRQWFEIWVPHKPSDWSKPKIVFPDISENPRFFFDDSKSIVHGDCYWITANAESNPDWLFLILAVTNSTFITKFYDLAFHNKLYSGRRRFMTQYVKNFPLPPLESKPARAILKLVKQILKTGATEKSEKEINSLVWEAFGLVEEISR